MRKLHTELEIFHQPAIRNPFLLYFLLVLRTFNKTKVNISLRFRMQPLYWWKTATEDWQGVGNSCALEDRLFAHHGCLAGPVIDIYDAVCIRTKAMRGTER